MNRYVVIITENFDQYDVGIPRTVETSLTKDELVGLMREYHAALPDVDYEGFPGKKNGWGKPSFVIPGTLIEIDSHNLQRYVPGHGSPPYPYEFCHPPIFTLDEWFELTKNKVVNL